jgi:hypothetical protein
MRVVRNSQQTMLIFSNAEINRRVLKCNRQSALKQNKKIGSEISQSEPIDRESDTDQTKEPRRSTGRRSEMCKKKKKTDSVALSPRANYAD